MSGMTTIKVPKALRDRIASRAQEQGSTLAGAISRALDDADESHFWRRVREENARLSDEVRESYVHDGTLRDDLADPGDDQLMPEEW